MGKRIFYADSGLIMLETLLTLPVYLIMLAAIFWLGDTCLTRLTITHGERLRLWESGNWNHSGKKSAEEIFYFLTPGTGSSADVSTGYSDFSDSFSTVSAAANGWGRIQEGHASVNVRRSAWSRGISDVSLNSFWSWTPSLATDNSNTAWTVRARAANDGTTQNSSSLFRTGNGGRSGNEPYNGSIQWNSIYLGTWDSFVTPPVPKGTAQVLSPYGRNALYRYWSK